MSLIDLTGNPSAVGIFRPQCPIFRGEPILLINTTQQHITKSPLILIYGGEVVYHKDNPEKPRAVVDATSFSFLDSVESDNKKEGNVYIKLAGEGDIGAIKDVIKNSSRGLGRKITEASYFGYNAKLPHMPCAYFADEIYTGPEMGMKLKQLLKERYLS